MARGGPGLARLLPRRRRADLGPAGPEGGPLLRRGARPPTTRSCGPARRCTAPTSSPREPAGFRAAVLEYMAALTRLGHALMARPRAQPGPGGGLTSPTHYTARPAGALPHLQLPARPADRGRTAVWGVGEHTDYGVLTILKQDDAGGLEVKSRAARCLGRGAARRRLVRLQHRRHARPHDRAACTAPRRTACRNRSGRDRLSFPFFFDPDFERRGPADRRSGAPSDTAADDAAERWDGASVHAFQGTYGDYLLGKVGKVFPTCGPRSCKPSAVT